MERSFSVSLRVAMSFTGHIADGRVVFDGPVSPPDGTLVRIEPIAQATGTPPLLERLGGVVGKATGLPAGAATNVDYYLYGHPKK